MVEVENKYGEKVASVDDVGTIRNKYGEETGKVVNPGPDTVEITLWVIAIALLLATSGAIIVILEMIAMTWVGPLALLVVVGLPNADEALVTTSAIIFAVFLPYLVMVIRCKLKHKQNFRFVFKYLFRWFLKGPFAYPEILKAKKEFESAK